MPILPSQSWSRFDWDCCDSSILLILSSCLSASFDPDLTDTAAIQAYCYYPHTSQPLLIQIWPEGVVILADLLVVCQYSPPSFDSGLTETAVIQACLLILSPYLSPSLDPDLTETAVILAYLIYCYYPHTSLSQSWSRFDRRSCDSSIPAGSMPILPSQFLSRFHRDSPNLAYSLVVCQYLSPSLDPDLTETAVILAYLLILSSYLSASLDPDLTEGVVILADSSIPASSMLIFPS